VRISTDVAVLRGWASSYDERLADGQRASSTLVAQADVYRTANSGPDTDVAAGLIEELGRVIGAAVADYATLATALRRAADHLDDLQARIDRMPSPADTPWIGPTLTGEPLAADQLSLLAVEEPWILARLATDIEGLSAGLLPAFAHDAITDVMTRLEDEGLLGPVGQPARAYLVDGRDGTWHPGVIDALLDAGFTAADATRLADGWADRPELLAAAVALTGAGAAPERAEALASSPANSPDSASTSSPPP
jgi:hypothetical protein